MAQQTPIRHRSAGPDLPDRVTMPLLALVVQGAVDEDYVHAARRRVDAGHPVTPRGRHNAVLAVVAVFGLLIAVAAVQTSRNAGVDNASRAALIERIDARRATVASQEKEIRTLRKQNGDLQKASGRLDATLRVAQGRLTTLQVATGFVAVTGPGVSISVDDDPDGDANGRVRASDLRLLVNALWESGAEAIAINGRRLTTLSSIVNANISVQVNRLPTSPPYVVSAIGDARVLFGKLDTSTSGVSFQSLTQEFGFVVDRQNESRLTLAAAPATQLRLRWVKAATGQGPENQEDTTP
jgi:uncharacterized protein YlxW (UPF0749 family)